MEDFLEKQKAIEDLLMDMEVFEQVENKVSKFNAFETLGIVNTEIRHSNVLAWILSPRENHGLGDVFIKKFIKTLFYKNKDIILKSGLSLMDVSLMDFYDFNIRREWRNIDILAISEENKLAIVIENKVWSKESNFQLKKYYDIVDKEFSEYSKVFVFLTPQGGSPSDEENWISFNYKEIYYMLKELVELKKGQISNGVELFIQQYLDVLGRYMVGDFELEKICREIYYKHQKALDLIYEYKPDIYSEISDYIINKLDGVQEIIKDDSNKTLIRFITKNIDNVIEKKGSGWTSTNRILLFEIRNSDKLTIKLIIGPGDDAIRIRLYDIASQNINLFKGKLTKLTPQYTQIFSKELMPKEYINKYDNNVEVIQNKINSEIEKFINDDLRKIDDLLRKTM